jgi:hypothetical protein
MKLLKTILTAFWFGVLFAGLMVVGACILICLPVVFFVEALRGKR